MRKHVFHSPECLRAGPPALSFSYCFGITLHWEESPALWQRAVNRQPGFRSNNS